jgi:hypothetical protein
MHRPRFSHDWKLEAPRITGPVPRTSASRTRLTVEGYTAKHRVEFNRSSTHRARGPGGAGFEPANGAPEVVRYPIKERGRGDEPLTRPGVFQVSPVSLWPLPHNRPFAPRLMRLHAMRLYVPGFRSGSLHQKLQFINLPLFKAFKLAAPEIPVLGHCPCKSRVTHLGHPPDWRGQSNARAYFGFSRPITAG